LFFFAVHVRRAAMLSASHYALLLMFRSAFFFSEPNIEVAYVTKLGFPAHKYFPPHTVLIPKSIEQRSWTFD